MFEGISGALGAIKAASPKILASVAIACGLLLFAPSALLNALGMTEVVSTYRSLIGLSLLASVVLLVADFLWWLSSKWHESRQAKHMMSVRIQSLSELTPDEKAYLLPYVASEDNTLYYSVEDGVVWGLVRKEILYQAAHVGDMVNGFAFNMQPWARRHLSSNQHLLNGAAPSPPTPRQRFGLY